jgi:O-antigen/teichoic acid export membrane protein
VLANVVLDVILIPQIGVIGAAIGSDVGLAVYVIPQFALCTGMLGVAVTPQLVTLARCLVAGAASAGVLAAFGTGRLSLAVMIVGGATGMLVYAAALLLTREVSRQEAASIAGAAVRRLRPSVP